MPGRRHSALLAKLAANRADTSQRAIVDELRRVILDGGAPPGCPIPVNEVAEMYIVRETLESAALAAAVVNATDDDRTAIARAHHLLERAVREDDPHTYHRQSRHFHIGMTRPSGMLRLVHMLESAWNITEPVQLMVHVEPADRAALHTDHGQMLEAFLDRDVESLLAVSSHHHRRLNTVVATLPTDSGLISRG